MSASLTKVRIGLFPASELNSRHRLFAALEAAYPVSFDGREAGAWEGLDGLLIVGTEVPPAVPPSLPVLHALGEERRGDSMRTLTLIDDAELARPLRGARLTDGWSPTPDSKVWQGHLPIATAKAIPVWAAVDDGTNKELVCATPAELAPGEALRERLVPGRCLALLALAHFLQAVSRDPRVHMPPLQAAFVLDDPNLHWPSYGHVNYEQISRHALAHNYHVVVAMVPLDGWLAHPRVVRIFKERSAQLSICIHGNDHDGPELGRVTSESKGAALAWHALQRARAFERRTGIPVDKVMVPPHEKLSRSAARGLFVAGYEAASVSRPYPWIAAGDNQSPLIAPPERGALAGWTSPEIVTGGLPLLLRAGFNAPREDLVLRAFLGQPLILYGHHDLLAHGLEVLSEAAATINALGDVRWGALAEVARAGVQTRLLDQRFDVTMLTRHTTLTVPASVRELRLDARALSPIAGTHLRALVGEHRQPILLTATEIARLNVDGGETVELTLAPTTQMKAVSLPRMRLSPLLRRIVTEGRDRVRALRPADHAPSH